MRVPVVRYQSLRSQRVGGTHSVRGDQKTSCRRRIYVRSASDDCAVAETDKSSCGGLTDVKRRLVPAMMDDACHCPLKCSVDATDETLVPFVGRSVGVRAGTVSVTPIHLDVS